jgi:hypothetical protein
VVNSLIGISTAGFGRAYGDTPAAKWYDTIGMSGYLQASYVANLNDPKSRVNADRQFDTNSNSFIFNSFLLQIAKPVGDSDHYGFTVKLKAGNDAQVLNTVAGTGNASFAFQEAYLTYAVPSLPKLQISGGKFVTLEGVEVVDTIYNPNFSEGLLFTEAECIAHTGARAVYTFNDKVNATFGVINGWDIASDNNDGKTVTWQVATTPTKQTSWSFQGTYGKELPDPTHSQRLSLDTVGGYNPTDKLSLNAQLNWGQQTNDPDTAGGAGTSHWSGAGIWASYAATSKFTEIARFEVLNDQNNAFRFGSSPALINEGNLTGVNQTVKEFTLTHKTQLTSNMFTRLEFRHDWSNQAFFEKSDGSAVRNQNTISADWYVTF